MRAIAILALLIVAGCATAEKFKQHMDSTLGYTEGQLIARIGPPDRAYGAGDGTKVLQYTRSASWVIPGQSVRTPQTSSTTMTSPYGGTYTGTTTTYTQTTTPAHVVPLTCVMNFIFRGGVVSSWNSSGNGCKA